MSSAARGRIGMKPQESKSQFDEVPAERADDETVSSLSDKNLQAVLHRLCSGIMFVYYCVNGNAHWLEIASLKTDRCFLLQCFKSNWSQKYIFSPFGPFLAKEMTKNEFFLFFFFFCLSCKKHLLGPWCHRWLRQLLVESFFLIQPIISRQSTCQYKSVDIK